MLVFAAETRETRVTASYAFDEHWSLRASLGDLLSQSQANGGVGLGTVTTSAMFLGVIMVLVVCVSIPWTWPPIATVFRDDDR